MVLYFLKSGLGVLNPHVLIRGFLLYQNDILRGKSFTVCLLCLNIISNIVGLRRFCINLLIALSTFLAVRESMKLS